MMLITERAELSPVSAADAAELHALWSDADVAHYLFDGVRIPADRTSSVVAESERLFSLDGSGLWAARDRDDGSLVGVAGFWFFRDPPEMELLYAIHRSRWGHGLATEISRAVIDYGVTRLGFESIRASTDAPNAASVRVLEKLGFNFRRRATVAGIDTLFFELECTVPLNRSS